MAPPKYTHCAISSQNYRNDYIQYLPSCSTHTMRGLALHESPPLFLHSITTLWLKVLVRWTRVNTLGFLSSHKFGVGQEPVAPVLKHLDGAFISGGSAWVSDPKLVILISAFPTWHLQVTFRSSTVPIPRTISLFVPCLLPYVSHV